MKITKRQGIVQSSDQDDLSSLFKFSNLPVAIVLGDFLQFSPQITIR